MSGEATFNRNMYEVVQEIIRQLLVNGDETFDYQSSYGLRSAVPSVSSEEQRKLLGILHGKGVIRLNHYRVHNPGTEVMMETQLGDEAEIEAMMSQVYEVTASKEKLERYADSLDVSVEERQPIAKMVICTLRLHDVNLMLKVGEYPEQQIGRLQEDRRLHKLMIALTSRPGVDIKSADVLPNVDNLWQIFGKSEFDYLSPFFNHANKSMRFYPSVELTKEQVHSLVSRVTGKYRKNLENIAKNL